jgi:regulator of RNase E activity RraA
MEADELIQRYERLSTPLIYDVLDHMGYPNQALSSRIRPLDPRSRLAGPAFTIEGREADSPGIDPTLAYQLFREIPRGAVLVLATHGHMTSGPWGENTTLSAQLRGARGLVTDGGVRDAEALLAMGFPTFCSFVTPVFSGGRFAITGYQKPVPMPGQVIPTVIVRPGDLVVADANGVVIVPASIAEEVLLAAEQLLTIEERIRAALRAGEDREAVYRRYPKFEHISKRVE